MADVLGVQREFELQSCYYIHFRTNIIEKGTFLSLSIL